MEVFVLNLLQKVLVIDLTRSLIPASAQQCLTMHVKVRFSTCMPVCIRMHTHTHTSVQPCDCPRQYSCFAPLVQLKSQA